MSEAKRHERQVICPYCKTPAMLTDSAEIYGGRSYGMIWICRPCDAYVGTHKNSKDHAPLGRLANKELREWKKKAHAVFDPLWKTGNMVRKEAYRFLCEKMNMTEAQAHIGKFDVDECKRLVEILNR